MNINEINLIELKKTLKKCKESVVDLVEITKLENNPRGLENALKIHSHLNDVGLFFDSLEGKLDEGKNQKGVGCVSEVPK